MSRNEDLQRRRLLHYMAEIRTLLRMDNWDIVLHKEDAEDGDAHAETWQDENHYVLNIRLSKDFWGLEPAGVRNVVIHELTHSQHRDVTVLWDACTQNNDGIAVSEARAWDLDFRMFMERFVSWIADRLENQMPMWDPKKPVPSTLPVGCYLHTRPS